jgi:hypothetical protein
MHDGISGMQYRPPIGGRSMQRGFIPLPGRITGPSFTIPSGMFSSSREALPVGGNTLATATQRFNHREVRILSGLSEDMEGKTTS